MFWIIGAEDLFHALNKISDTGITRVMAEQLDHEDWEGFHFYDLIFPMFVFIIGVSLVFSLSRIIQQEGRAAAIRIWPTRELEIPNSSASSSSVGSRPYSSSKRVAARRIFEILSTICTGTRMVLD